jgi:(hydroxyamino)benzene mutase
MDPAVADLRRRLARAGATLFAIGLVTGLWSAAALTGKVKVDEPHLALAAHLNALLGGLWILGLAFTLEYMSYAARARRTLAVLTLASAWGNWLITLVASVLGRKGLEYNADAKNNLVAVLLQVVVVLPGLVGGVMWAWGFRGGRGGGART